MKPSTQKIYLAVWSLLVASANANEILCMAVGFFATFAAPEIKTMVFENVKDDLTVGLPVGGSLLVKEPGDPEFNGCAFSVPMQMGVDSDIVNLDNVGVFTVEGTMDPMSLLQGQMCVEDVQVTDYNIQGLPLNVDSLLDGRLPAIGVSEQSCMGIMDTLLLAFSTLVGGGGGGGGGKGRMLRGNDIA